MAQMTTNKPAYVLVDTKITDPVAYEDYKTATKPIAEHYGGVYLTRGGKMDIMQTELWAPARIVLVKFPSMEAAHAFLESPEYAPVKSIRLANSKATLLVLEGL
tara:strand:- start:2979 stop:3290 length:312 start_codon:yes stop_codon:yes gene_type:complete